MKIILASSSPRRESLLHKITDNFDTVAPAGTEIKSGKPSFIAQKNAEIKGKSITIPYDVLIACDTLVSYSGKIYGKPKNFENAFAILKKLNGKVHSVFSGVYINAKGKEYSFIDESKVTFRFLTEEKIVEYINKYKPFDKAGAYGIQDKIIVESYEGDYDNIMGFPTGRIREILREFINVKD